MSEAMEDVIFEHSEQPLAGNGEGFVGAIPALCAKCQSFGPPSPCTYLGHDVVESSEESELCNLNIFHDITPKDEQEGGGAEKKLVEGRTEAEGESEIMSGSSSNNFGDFDEENLSDMEVEVGNFDLEDVLEAERVVGVDEEDKEEGFVQHQEDGLFFRCSETSQDRSARQATSPPQTPLLSPGLFATLPARRPPFFNEFDEEDKVEAESPQVPKINGVDVCMGEIQLTAAEVGFYSDPFFGRWRVKLVSPLRMCWMPLEN